MAARPVGLKLADVERGRAWWMESEISRGVAFVPRLRFRVLGRTVARDSMYRKRRVLHFRSIRTLVPPFVLCDTLSVPAERPLP
eukprot:501099-Rhodomonas_salina.3